jgi:hypothetical protein
MNILIIIYFLINPVYTLFIIYYRNIDIDTVSVYIEYRSNVYLNSPISLELADIIIRVVFFSDPKILKTRGFEQLVVTIIV